MIVVSCNNLDPLGDWTCMWAQNIFICYTDTVGSLNDGLLLGAIIVSYIRKNSFQMIQCI